MPKFLNTKKDADEKIDYAMGSVAQCGIETFDLHWVDDFVRKIKPYVYVREVDRLLILIPNQAYGLNEPGLRIMNYLLPKC